MYHSLMTMFQADAEAFTYLCVEYVVSIERIRIHEQGRLEQVQNSQAIPLIGEIL